MTKAIAIIAFSLALEAAFLFQVSVIARPEPRAAAPAAVVHVATEAGGETVARSVASAAPRS